MNKVWKSYIIFVYFLNKKEVYIIFRFINYGFFSYFVLKLVYGDYMDRKILINDYILKLNDVFTNGSFEDFLSFFYSYNTVNKYNDDISNFIELIYNKVVNYASVNNIRFNNFENDFEYNIDFIFYESSSFQKVKVYIPFAYGDLDLFCNIILEYLFKEEVNVSFNFLKKSKNSNLILEFDSTSHFKRLIRFLKMNNSFSRLIKNKLNPFIPIVHDFGIVCEYDHFDYLDFVIMNIIDYFSLSKFRDNYNIDSFCDYVNDKIFSVKYLGLKRMYVSLYRCIKCISDSDDIFDVFSYDSNMNISSVMSNDYNVRYDSDGLIYFVNIYDKREVRFGDEFYLNVAYSKFYNISIEMSMGDEFYIKFFSIYDTLINNNFNFKEVFMEFDSVDDIYKQLYLFSSGFFALKKLGFSLDDVYGMLRIMFFNIFGKNIMAEGDDYVKESYVQKSEEYVLPFDEEFSKSVFSLKNGDLTTVIAYFKINKILDIIPSNSIITMKNGSVVKAIDFLMDIKYIAYKYDSFKDIVNDLIFCIEY